ncbi:secretin and TonB N-terminal domain-containing protein [candidate division WOR-3 bacterium]|nr:secretin and TonB N-terminal domain-containing protein [candidate division WOR-3 bacterium]
MRKTIMSLFIFILSLSAVSLNDIRVKSLNGVTDVLLIFDKSVKNFSDFTVDSKIAIDVIGGVSNYAGKAWGVSRGGIDTIDVSQIPSANLLRVIIGRDSSYNYTVTSNANTLLVTIETGSSPFAEWGIKGQTVAPKEVKTVRETYKPVKGISLEFENADLVTALRAIAEYARKNIIIGDDVKGTITVKLDNVPWERALRLILQTKGYAYVIEGNIIRVGTGKQFESERENKELAELVVQKVFRLEFTTVEEIKPIIQNLLSKRGSINIDKRTNSLIVRDIGSKVNSIESLVRILDSKTPQVAIEARVVDVDRTNIRDIGVNWGSENMQKAAWNIKGKASLTPSTTPIAGLDLTLGTIRNYAKLLANIKALENKNKLSTIANPRVTTANNKEARIFGGKQFAITTIDIRGNPITQWFKAGIELNVTPHINSLQDITMDVKVELSDVISEKEITKTEANTQSLVKDGETLVIGGFIHRTETKHEEGVPFLMSIPLLGRLFKRTYTEDRDREVLIFLTPHIVKTD